MRYARLLPKSLQAIAALLLPLILISCTGSAGSRGVLPRELPAKPEWAVPVAVPRPADGTDFLEITKREQNGRLEANARLQRFGDWYDERRQEYGAGR